jgi:hypothetical protein
MPGSDTSGQTGIHTAVLLLASFDVFAQHYAAPVWRPATTALTEIGTMGGATTTGSPARTPRPRIRPPTGKARLAIHCAR